jgi:photosystem II stability/assembly factor-like uncharacterized protein
VNEFAFDAKATGAIEVASPTPAIRWRVHAGNGAAIERSADGGETWTTQFTPAGAVIFTAGASPSPAVCWLVGRGGVVFVSRDGLTWQRIMFPEPVDLKAVSASGDRNATVVTADNRTFVTADGGQSWQVRKN